MNFVTLALLDNNWPPVFGSVFSDNDEAILCLFINIEKGAENCVRITRIYLDFKFIQDYGFERKKSNNN